MKKLGTLLSIIAIVALVWLVRSFITSDTLSPVTFMLILGLILAALLISKVSRNSKQDVESPPSQRKRSHEHKSWITRND
ncbi:MAG: hypothetical protein AAGU15_00600 [Anaerolineaceae bacterium]